MLLPDPELDLLKELLAEDPSADCYLVVGEQLYLRGQLKASMAVLARGLEAGDQPPEAYRLLAQVACEAKNYPEALLALESLSVNPSESPELARIQVIALAGVGQVDPAIEAAKAYLAVVPSDAPIAQVLDRLQSPPPDPSTRGRDRFFSVAQAERYVVDGRLDRAVRCYRRILYANPTDVAVAARLNLLLANPHQPFIDDLSDELIGSEPPPNLVMPSPSSRIPPVGREPAIVDHSQSTSPGGSGEASPNPPAGTKPRDDDPTTAIPVVRTHKAPRNANKRSSRRRRSLLNRD